MSLVQDTRLSRVQQRIGERLKLGLTSPWAQRSAVLIALLGGFLVGGTVAEHFKQTLILRSYSALFWLVIVELLIRLRSRVVRTPVPLIWQIVDNLRIGLVYAIVLEAFKVGS